MKDKKAAAIALLLVWLTLSFPLPTTGQSGIIVEGADSVLNMSVIYSSDLVSTTLPIGPRVAAEYSKSAARHALSEVPTALQTLVNAVPARVAAEYANSTTRHALSEAPTALQTLVNAVPARVAAEYANSTAPHVLVEIPTALQSLVSTVSERIVVEYADSTRGVEIAYPLELMDDSVPPQISGITVNPVGSGSVIISWTTDEFATSVVYYGTQPGVYPNTVSDPLYTEQHGIVLTGLLPETTYYFLVSSTDQSDNNATSVEQSFSTALYIVKSVTPQGQVDYGDELTYSVVISAMLETQTGFYDPLEGTIFVHFVQQPGNVIYDNNVITGTLTVPSGGQTTVSFVVQVVTPTVAGVTVDVTNKACIYPTGGTIAGDCTWSNEVTNEAFRPYGVYLPVVLRSHIAP